MSLATLKKKTAAKYNNSSVYGGFSNNQGFSLYGTRRNQGYVGQDTLGRSLPRTIMKNSDVHGNGGCCGTYNVTGIVQSSVKSQNDSSVVKPTVLNTKGMLAERQCRLRRCSLSTSGSILTQQTTVKPDDNLNNSDQSSYILKKKENMITAVDSPSCNVVYEKSNCNEIKNKNINCNITKDITQDKLQTQGMYLDKKVKDCYDENISNDQFTSNTIGFNTMC